MDHTSSLPVGSPALGHVHVLSRRWLSCPTLTEAVSGSCHTGHCMLVLSWEPVRISLPRQTLQMPSPAAKHPCAGGRSWRRWGLSQLLYMQGPWLGSANIEGLQRKSVFPKCFISVECIVGHLTGVSRHKKKAETRTLRSVLPEHWSPRLLANRTFWLKAGSHDHSQKDYKKWRKWKS